MAIRYDLEFCDFRDGLDLVESSTGSYVEHSDYITLENKYKKLKERVEDLTTSFNINPNFFFDSDE